ncbi:MAG: hypothetical protein NWE83_11795 [Candidatus Bathyarchaeota archaeon]|nr:hypothetical protein [Candidatus Bathyarchaeota archaeon]
MDTLDSATVVVITGTILTVLGIVVILLRRNQRDRPDTETNYRSLCNVGIIFLCAGIAISIASRMINPLLVLGLIFFAIGYANKDQWKPT